MITLNNFIKLENGQYQMILSIKKTDSLNDLPSATNPMDPEHFAVSIDYGVPADKSVAIKEDGEVLMYSSGKWEKVGKVENVKLKELFVEENGQYLPENEYVGFNKVVVDVKPKAVMPDKGELIKIDEKKYRVLKISDTVAEVLAMYDTTEIQKTGDGDVYENSVLDTYCNQEFYKSLKTSMQNAIIPKEFSQDKWTLLTPISEASTDPGAIVYNALWYEPIGGDYINYKYELSLAAYGANISRNCYILSCQDIIDYLGVTTSMNSIDTTLTSKNVFKMFWNRESLDGDKKDIYLRSAGKVEASQEPETLFNINSEIGGIFPAVDTSYSSVRPVFQIDLSKIEWTRY